MKKISIKKIAILAGAIMAISANVFAASFTDTVDHWAATNIAELTEAGVINGYPDGTFKPEGTITRAEFLKLVIAASLPEGVDIADAPASLNHWAGQHLYVAETYRIVSPGTIDEENINEPITRREMALMVSKADTILKRNELNQEVNVTYNDYDQMDVQELKYLSHAVSEGYITGYTDNTFKPDKNMTRAEAATIIYRYTRMGGNVDNDE